MATTPLFPTGDHRGSLASAIAALQDSKVVVLNVKTFGGAVGNGIANDRAAIQATLDALPASGGVVYFPTGDYLIQPVGPGDSHASLRPHSNTTLMGDGAGSIIRMQAGGWDVTVEPEADGLINHGVIVLAAPSAITQITDVRVTNLHLIGSMTTPDNDGYSHNPVLIGIYRGARITIDHCLFEDTHYGSLWNWGVETSNEDFLFVDNHILHCSWQEQTDFQGNGGGGAIQFNGMHIVVANNTFRHTGGALFITGAYNSAVGNTFEDFQGFAIDIGETINTQGSLVVGNTLRTTPAFIPGGIYPFIVIPTAILVDNSTPGFGYDMDNFAVIADNRIHFTILTSTCKSSGIQVTRTNAQVRGNTITWDIQADLTGVGLVHNGIQIVSFSDYVATVAVQNNTVAAYSYNAEPHFPACNSIAAFGTSPQGTAKITVYSAGNTANVPTACAAWAEPYTPGHPMAMHHSGDVSINGGISIGHSTVSDRAIPFHCTFDSDLSVVAFQTAVSLGIATAQALTVNTNVLAGKFFGSTGDLTKYDTQAGMFHRWFIDGAYAGHLRLTGFEAVGYKYGTGAGGAYDGPYHTSGAAAPIAGAWLVGDTVWNTAPAAGGTPGWVCTTAGTPGTWKAMAILAA